MVFPHCYFGGGAIGPQLHEGKVGPHLIRVVSHVGCVPEPQLSVVVVPPALHKSLFGPRTPVLVIFAQRYLHHFVGARGPRLGPP